MDSSRVEGNWKQIKGKAKEKWGKLTDDDLNVIQGQRDQLEGKIQERYGIAKDQVRRDVDDWYDSMKASGTTGGNSPGVASATNSLARGKAIVRELRNRAGVRSVCLRDSHQGGVRWTGIGSKEIGSR